jgi:hypothetical protein
MTRAGKLTAGGWGWPLNSRKAHYFGAGSITSLCNGWMYTGPREPAEYKSPDDCAACSKALPLLQRCPNCGSEAAAKKNTWCQCNESAPFRRIPVTVSASVDEVLGTAALGASKGGGK